MDVRFCMGRNLRREAQLRDETIPLSARRPAECFESGFWSVVLQVSNAGKFVAERRSCVLRLPTRKGCR